MSDRLIGVVVTVNNTDEILGRIERSEQAGIPAVWLTTGGRGTLPPTTTSERPGKQRGKQVWL